MDLVVGSGNGKNEHVPNCRGSEEYLVVGTRQLAFLIDVADVRNIFEDPCFHADLDKGSEDSGNQLNWSRQR